MRRVVGTAALACLFAAPSFAQTPAPAPAQPPAQAVPAPAPKAFPPGATIAFVDIQRVVQLSAQGKAASGQVQALQARKQTELTEKNKQLQGLQQKAQAGGVMSETAQADLAKQIDKAQKDIERAQQDAQQELQDLQQDLQADFQRKLMPIIQQVAAKRGLLMVFTPDAGIVWADAGIDLTGEVITAFDAAVPASVAPATKPPAPAKPPAGPKPPGR